MILKKYSVRNYRVEKQNQIEQNKGSSTPRECESDIAFGWFVRKFNVLFFLEWRQRSEEFFSLSRSLSLSVNGP